MKPVRFVLTIFLVAAGFAAGLGYGRWYGPRKGAPIERGAGRKILYYVDPMHPAYKSDKPGIAPDCGMKLEPVYADGAPSLAPGAGRRIFRYRDPVKPEYTSDKPGIDPETGSALEPVYAEADEVMPAGTIQIPQDKQQTIGVQFDEAAYTSAGETIRAVGKVALDETRVVRVHPKVEGWIEHVSVDSSGAPVRKGEALLTIYSAEMLASQKEYLLSLKARDLMKQGAVQSAVMNSDSLVEASRRRLELWDMSPAQIAEVERTGNAIHSITIYSPAGGFALARNAFPSQRVTPETELYEIADLSRVWIVADVYEADISKIRPGQVATIHMPYDGGRTFSARVGYLLPEVDPQTRTVKVRMEAANPGMRLRPEMFVDVEFPLASTRHLTVPVGAVLDAGRHQTVFVDRGNGYLEPRQVHAGEQLGDRVVILDGLRAGERIATSANFLIDSESQLQAAMSGMSGTAGRKP